MKAGRFPFIPSISLPPSLPPSPPPRSPLPSLQGDSSFVSSAGLSVVGVQQIHRVVEVVEETLKGSTVQLLGRQGRNALPSLQLPKVK